MREDFEINIRLRKGIYLDRYGNEYELLNVIKDLESLRDMALLKSLSTDNVFTCSVEYFTSPYINEDEDLLPLFRVKKLFKGDDDENSEV